MYLAKSNPVETIQEHTDNLLANYKILIGLYAHRLHEDIRQALKDVCLYHDLGKMNSIFQNKIKGIRNIGGEQEVPHGYLSIGFIKVEKMKEKYGIDLTRVIITAVAKHHDRDFNFSENRDYVRKKIKELEDRAVGFVYDKLPNIHQDLNTYSMNLLYDDGLINIDNNEDRANYILLKGLLNRIDYAASGHYRVEYGNDFLLDCLERHKASWGKDADYNDLQKFMLQHQDKNIIAVAETGYGKTEAGLLWIGNNKGFFTLPLRSAINSIFDRVRNNIIQQEKLDERLALLHSDALSELFDRSEISRKDDLALEGLEILEYNDRARQMSLPLTISTIDQIFKFVYRHRGFEQELATLSYSKVIIDEIQMYSPDLLAYLIIGLEMLTQVDGRFSIITATLPPFILDLLKERNIDFIMPDKPYYNADRVRHCIELKQEQINAQDIKEKYQNNKVLVIVNTVRKAQELYTELEEEIEPGNLRVFHGGFIKRDRKIIEEEIIKFGHKDNNESGIWICTQAAEASLDIDFDILITELSDANGLFQRMGRCYRNRMLEPGKTNIYVFDGGEEKCSGIGYVNDMEIYQLSKERLRKEFENRKSWRVGESDKIEIINGLYTTENLRHTKYYKELQNTIEYVSSIFVYELNRSEVIKRFRAINNIDVIPKVIYENNKDVIDRCISVLQEKYDFEQREEQRFKKTKARITLTDFTVSIPFYFSNYHNTTSIKITDYESINIYTCEYDQLFGVGHIKEVVRDEYKEHVDNVI